MIEQREKLAKNYHRVSLGGDKEIRVRKSEGKKTRKRKPGKTKLLAVVSKTWRPAAMRSDARSILYVRQEKTLRCSG